MLKNSDTSSDEDITYLNKQNNKLDINNGYGINLNNNFGITNPEENIKDNEYNEEKKESKDSTSTDALYNMLANPEKIQLDILNKDIVTPDNSSTSSSESSSSKTSKKSGKSDKSKKSSSSNRSRKSNRSQKNNDNIFSSNLNLPNKSVVDEVNNLKKDNTKNIIPPVLEEPPKVLSDQELRMKKIELLRKLSELKIKGYTLTKEYDYNSSIEDMEYEYDLLKSYADKQNGTKIFKSFLLNGISALEFLNERYDPFSFKLSGWTEHVSCEVDSWEDIMAEIYEKYKGNGKKMEPEIKLALLLLASGGQFHASNSLSSIPHVEQVLKNNPGLVNKIINQQNTQKSNFMSPHEINLENIKNQEKIKKDQIRQKQKEALNNRINSVNESVTNSTIKAPIGVDKLLGQINKANNVLR